MKPIQYQAPQYQDVGGHQPPITIREFRGLNKFDPLSIEDGFFTDIVNMDTDDYPTLTTRKGYTVDYQIASTGPGVQGMTSFRTIEGTEELHAIFTGDRSWRIRDNAGWRVIGGNVAGQSMNYQFATAKVDNTELGINQVCLFLQNGGGITYYYTGGNGSQRLNALPASARYISNYQNRLWCVVDEELWSSQLDNPLIWEINTQIGDSSAYRRQLETRNGERISALNGNFSRLLIGSPNTVQEQYGGVPSNFNITPVTNDSGPINMKSIVVLDGILYFVHESGIYQYAGGSFPDRGFSEIIKPLVKNVMQSNTYNTDSFRTVSGTDGKKLFFYVNDTLLVYDPRPGIQAWSKYAGIDPSAFAVYNKMLHIGDRSGRILRFDSDTDNGTPINWSVTTKAFTNESISRKMRWYKLWITAEIQGTMNVYLSKTVNGDDWELVKTYTGTGRSSERIIIPVTKYARENYIRIKLSGTGTAKIHDITRQQRQLPLY